MSAALRRLALALSVVLGLALVSVPQAQAYTISVKATIVSSGCSTNLAWKGKVSLASTNGLYPTVKPYGDTGTVKHCATKLKLSDSNGSKDYYVLDTTANFATTSNSNFDGGSPWSLSATSNRVAVGYEYNATPTFSKGTSNCTQTLSIGYSFAGIASVSTGNLINCNVTITRNSLSSTAAKWSSPRADRVSAIDVTYSQAVNQGTVPTFTVKNVRPYYTYSYTQAQSCYTSCWMGWKPTQLTSSSSWTVTR